MWRRLAHRGSRSSQATPAAVDKSQGAAHTEMLTPQEAVELATLEWAAWFKTHRRLKPIGYIPPAEAEANYYWQLATQATKVAA